MKKSIVAMLVVIVCALLNIGGMTAFADVGQELVVSEAMVDGISVSKVENFDATFRDEFSTGAYYVHVPNPEI